MFRFNSFFTAIFADLIEHSTVKTISFGISTYCPMKARFFDPFGTTSGLSRFLLGKNWLVMYGIIAGMQIADFVIERACLFVSMLPPMWKRTSSKISFPLQSDIFFFM